MSLLLFQRYQPKDFLLYYKLVREKEVMKYITEKGLSKDEARKNFSRTLKLNEEHTQLGYYKIYKNQEFIGNCKLVNYRKDNSIFEIGYVLHQEFWGKGLGTQVCEYMLKLADEIHSEKDIIGIINPKNIVSKKLLEKFGFKTFFLGVENDMETEKLILRKNDSQ
ncbi:MAG: GNAT family N-acetyltransferase [Moheibacter sp.]